MKMNWKVIAAIVVSIAVVVWAISSVVPSSFNGTNVRLTGPTSALAYKAVRSPSIIHPMRR